MQPLLFLGTGRYCHPLFLNCVINIYGNNIIGNILEIISSDVISIDKTQLTFDTNFCMELVGKLVDKPLRLQDVFAIYAAKDKHS